uniref:non-specific serine/threonine protein kinase n=1 Tax=Stichopus japonicus TaxID=307972 RepID=A0A6G5QCE0_STIJA|nr:ULK [Apostichopus japonicus]
MMEKMESVDDYEYHTSDFIGHGAFAVVFKGRNKKKTDQVVAIKNIHKKNLSKSQTFPEKEIEILKELHHENVVALLHFKESPSSLFMVMEFCNGGDLADYLHVKGTLSEGTICLFLRQIAAAMKTLHAKGIIHRDLKPQNLLLSHKGKAKPHPPPSEIIIKIADFGFARFLEEDMMAATICGSPLYMAPEVITSQQYTAKADLWSVGTIIYQCLTGSAPFKASNPKELKMFYEKARAVEPKIFPGTSEHMRDLLLRLLKRAQKDRIEFDAFFNHPFLRTKVQSTASTSPLPVPARTSSCSSESPDAPMSISPGTSSIPISSPEDPIVIDPQGKFPSPDNSPIRSPLLKTIVETSGMCETVEDDFVLVSTSVPRRTTGHSDSVIQVRASSRGQPSVQPSGAQASPPFPSHFSTPFGTGDNGHDSSPSPSGRPSSLQLGSESPQSQPPKKSTKLSPKAIPANALVLHRTSPHATQKRTKVSSPTPGTTLSPITYSSSLPTGGILHRISHSPSPSPPLTGGRRGSPSSGESDSPKSWVLKMSPPNPLRKHTETTPPRLIKSPTRRKTSSPARLTSPQQFTSPPSLPAIQAGPASRHDSSPSEPISLPFIYMSRRVRTSSDLTDDGCNSLRDNIPFRRSASFSRIADQNALRAAFDSLPKTPSASLEGIPGACLAVTPPTFPTFFIGASQSRRSSQYGEGSPSSQGSITFAASPPNMEGPITFEAPELVEETIMKPEHNETVERLNIMYGIVSAIMELAQSRSDPLAESVYYKDIASSASHICFISENQRRAEQIVLYARAMQLLTAALKLAKDEIKLNKLMNSKAVRNVITQLHNQYKECFHQCRCLQTRKVDFTGGEVEKDSVEIAADRLMYSHALDLCQSSGFEEMCGNPEECIGRYHSAQMLLHGLCLQATQDRDRDQLLKLKNILDQRLIFLEKQVHSTTTATPFAT